MGSLSQNPKLTLDERLKILYPMVNENDTPLPRCWSTKDKYSYTGLSQNNLRVQYKGHGKTHKDASSVRATHPIPASCGIFYYEVRIVSKGRDGYMGVGLSTQGVNMNRLPGWDKHSYGYHGDDGHSFCSSGNGQVYGPTFTTGDVIGCGVNLVDNTCFYTKNGHNLGVAFRDLPPNLYPTVGLQTPGEVMDSNFGQEPFVFDIEGEMFEYRSRIRNQITNTQVPGKLGEWQELLQSMVITYLIHHGYCSTAEAFVRSTGESITEEISSVKNRQTIQKLVLSGKVGQAISLTQKLYPRIFDERPHLKFSLQVRHFIEVVGGVDDENDDDTDSMEIDPCPVCTNPKRFQKLIEIGRGLQTSLGELEKSLGKNEANTRMLQEAFSLMAYADPWNSPVGWQLHTSQRDEICRTLNSAILESKSLPGKPPLENCISHAETLFKYMTNNSLGACAFANINDFLK